MPGLRLPFIQIAGIRSRAEAKLLEECGVGYLGFPLRLAVHAEDASEAEVARMVAEITPPAQGVMITYLDDPEAIAALCGTLGFGIVQLHSDIRGAALDRLRALDPDLTIVKSLVVGRKDPSALEADVLEFSPRVDAFLTDTYDPASGASGATGKTHDWRISRRLVEISSRPVILAGGLTPENVAAAIREVRPAGVDSHTGVEDASGAKSRERVVRFVREAMEQFRRMTPDEGG
jgi:phosphoribosylanthranilate isomerase